MRARFAVAALWAAFLLPPTAAWATQDFDAFVASRSAASQPLGSGDKFPVIQGGITKYIQGNLIADTTSAQTLTNKTINGNNNTLTILAATQLSGTVPVANGGTNLASYTSGGVVCATGSTTLASSGALTANLPVIGGGAGVCPAVGSVTGNTTKFVTNTGVTTSGSGVSWDASGNLVTNANAVFTNVAQTFSAAQTFGSTIGSQNNQTTGTGYTLQLSDCGKTIYVTVGVAFTITTLNTLPVGCTIAVEQGGAGQVTISGSPLNPHNFTKTFAQGAIIGLYVDANSGGSSAHYVLTGDGA
jgi:hypothetical protein